MHNLLSLAYLVTLAQARPEYQSKIPNGENVRDYPGVGHDRAEGGGSRNPFGLDFEAASFTWTVELCGKDSDGDGLSNGLELGDPNCEWKEGDSPTFDVGITHPGFAEDDRPSAKVDTCESYVEQAGTETTDITFPSYNVEAKQTTYVKLAFTWPSAADRMATKFEVINLNPTEVHHMILYRCPNDASTQFATPREGPMPCQEWINAWAVGGKDFCLPPNLGVELEVGDFLLLEIHYDNPSLSPSVVDSSGFRIHHIPTNVAYQKVGTLMVGSDFSMTVPPGQPNYHLKAGGQLTFLDSNINIFASMLHAHKLGRKLWIAADAPPRSAQCDKCNAALQGYGCRVCFSSRDPLGCCGSSTGSIAVNSQTYPCSLCEDTMASQGGLGDVSCLNDCAECYPKDDTCNAAGFADREEDLACNTNYNFDLQEVSPRAENYTLTRAHTLTMHCVYDSTSRTYTTQGGDASDDEMCIGLFLYYPKTVNSNLGGVTTPIVVSDGSAAAKTCGADQQPTAPTAGTTATTTSPANKATLGTAVLLLFLGAVAGHEIP